MNKNSEKITVENANYALERLRELLNEGVIEPNGKLPTERALSAASPTKVAAMPPTALADTNFMGIIEVRLRIEPFNI